MFELVAQGNWEQTMGWLQKAQRGQFVTQLEEYGQRGVQALASATPRDSGETARSWTYEVKKTRGGFEIVWSNTHVQNGVPIAVLLQMGHGQRQGGYVQGRDFINPAMRSVFDDIAKQAWKAVSN